MIHVVLYEPEIPQNTGNIMRTCMASNSILHLIEPLGFILDEKHLKRAGMDYANELEIHKHENWDAFLTACPEADLFYVTRYGDRAPSDFDFTQCLHDIYLVFGKESTGIPKTILKENLNRCMRIPMVSEARSLNLSNCVSIVVYEALRQLDYPSLSKTEVLKGEDFLRTWTNESN